MGIRSLNALNTDGRGVRLVKVPSPFAGRTQPSESAAKQENEYEGDPRTAEELATRARVSTHTHTHIPLFSFSSLCVAFFFFV